MFCLVKIRKDGNREEKAELSDSGDPCEEARKIIRNDDNIYEVKVYELKKSKRVVISKEVMVYDEDNKEIERSKQEIKEKKA